jgi:hypothetical protein
MGVIMAQRLKSWDSEKMKPDSDASAVTHPAAHGGHAAAAEIRWIIRVGEGRYGPYSLDELKAYSAAGRVAPYSVVSRDGKEDWHMAADDPHLSAIFPPSGDDKQDGVPAEDETGRATQASPVHKASAYRSHEPQTANFVIILDVKSRSTSRLEEKVMSMGTVFKLSPSVWLVHGKQTAAGLVNALSPHLGVSDSLFVVDATHDRTAWCNLGPELDAKVRSVWKRESR